MSAVNFQSTSQELADRFVIEVVDNELARTLVEEAFLSPNVPSAIHDLRDLLDERDERIAVSRCLIEKLSEQFPLSNYQILANLPRIFPDFVRRVILLKNLEQMLPDQPVGNMPLAVKVLIGPGGFGKSELAIQFAHESIAENKFRLVWRFQCGSVASFEDDLRALGKDLKLSKEIEEKPRDAVMKIIYRHLEQEVKCHPFLLIFDNLEELCTLPVCGGCCILTTRYGDIYPYPQDCLEIPPFTAEETQQLYEKLQKGPHKKFLTLEQATTLTTKLEGYPLLLGHALRKILKCAHIEQYLKHLDTQGAPLEIASQRYPATMRQVIEEVGQRLLEKDALAYRFFRFCTHLSPDHISLALLDEWLCFQHIEDRVKVSLGIVASLVDSSLMRYDPDHNSQSFSMHHLNKTIFESSQTDASSFAEALEIVARHVGKFDFDKMQSWANGKEGSTQLAALQKSRFWEKSNKEMRAELLKKTGLYLLKIQADLGFSRACLNESLQLVREDDTESAILEAEYQDMIGKGLDRLGRYEEALKNKQQALARRIEILGEDHLQVAASWCSVAISLAALNRDDEALQNKKRAEAIWIKRALNNDVYVKNGNNQNAVISARIFSELGNHLTLLEQQKEDVQYYLHSLQRLRSEKSHSQRLSFIEAIRKSPHYSFFKEALKEQERALAIQIKTFGNDHPEVAVNLNDIGITLAALGRHEEALRYYRQAIETWNRVLEGKHPDIAKCLNNIGMSLSALGQYEEALQYYQQAIEIWSRALGEKHPYRADGLNNIGENLSTLGRHEEALANYQQALALQIEVFGENHPDVAHSFSLIGKSFSNLGCHKESLKNLRKSMLVIYNVELKANFGDRKRCLGSIGTVLVSLGQSEEALQGYREVLKVRIKESGEDHPDVAESLLSIGIALSALGRHEEALQNNQRALAIQLKVLEKTHPDIISNSFFIGVYLAALGRHEEALQNYRLALEIQTKTLGENHPDVAENLRSIGISLSALGRHEEALQHHQRALAIHSTLGEDNLDLSINLFAMGTSLIALGRREEAVKVRQRALDLKVKIVGENHSYIASGFSSIADSLLKLSRFEEALQHFQRALAIRLKVLEKTHPDIASNSCHIGLVLATLNRHEEALQSYQLALEIQTKALGENHPDVAESLRLISLSLYVLGRHEEALHSKQQFLKAQIKIYGENHSKVARSHSDIGASFYALSRYQEALKNHQRALTIWAQALGENHPDVVMSIGNVGDTLGALNRHEEALQHYQRALEIQKARLGEEHQDTAVSYSDVGIALYHLGRYQEALKNHQHAVKIRLKVMGEDHPKVAESLNNIGDSLYALGNREEFLKKHQQALTIRIKTLGESHPDVATTYTKVGASFYALSRYEEALKNHQKALAIRMQAEKGNSLDLAASYNNVSMCFFVLGYREEATAHYKKAIALNKS